MHTHTITHTHTHTHAHARTHAHAQTHTQYACMHMHVHVYPVGPRRMRPRSGRQAKHTVGSRRAENRGYVYQRPKGALHGATLHNSRATGGRSGNNVEYGRACLVDRILMATVQRGLAARQLHADSTPKNNDTESKPNQPHKQTRNRADGATQNTPELRWNGSRVARRRIGRTHRTISEGMQRTLPSITSTASDARSPARQISSRLRSACRRRSGALRRPIKAWQRCMMARRAAASEACARHATHDSCT